MGVRRTRRLVIAVLAALLVAGVIGTQAAGAAASYKIALYTTTGSAHPGLVGHVFVQLRHGATNLIFGKGPGGRWVFNTDGKIRDDGDRTWSYRITYQVNADRWQKADEYLQQQRRHPDAYKLLSDNCVQFTVHVAQKAGLAVPDYRNFAGAPEPRVFYNSLQGIGDGHSFRTGLVNKNPHPQQTASGAPDPPFATPPCCDVDGILAVAVSNPRKLAHDLRLAYRVYQLGPASLAGDSSFRVVINHTDTNQNLYAITWGDGTHTLGDKPHTSGPGVVTFSHHYSEAPSHPLKVVILQNGRVLKYVQSLRPSGPGSHSEVDSEPAPPPQRAYP